MHDLDYCPFCGGEEANVKVRFDKKQAIYYAKVECEHCCATGTTMGEDPREEAVEAAVRYWNEAHRPNPLLMKMRLKYYTFVDDVRDFFREGWRRD